VRPSVQVEVSLDRRCLGSLSGAGLTVALGKGRLPVDAGLGHWPAACNRPVNQWELCLRIQTGKLPEQQTAPPTWKSLSHGTLGGLLFCAYSRVSTD
jgi:hypothetical protein